MKAIFSHTVFYSEAVTRWNDGNSKLLAKHFLQVENATEMLEAAGFERWSEDSDYFVKKNEPRWFLNEDGRHVSNSKRIDLLFEEVLGYPIYRSYTCEVEAQWIEGERYRLRGGQEVIAFRREPRFSLVGTCPGPL